MARQWNGLVRRLRHDRIHDLTLLMLANPGRDLLPQVLPFLRHRRRKHLHAVESRRRVVLCLCHRCVRFLSKAGIFFRISAIPHVRQSLTLLTDGTLSHRRCILIPGRGGLLTAFLRRFSPRVTRGTSASARAPIFALSSASAMSAPLDSSSWRNFDSSVSPDSSPASSAPPRPRPPSARCSRPCGRRCRTRWCPTGPCIVSLDRLLRLGALLRAIRMFFLRLASSILLLRRRSASLSFSTACFCRSTAAGTGRRVSRAPACARAPAWRGCRRRRARRPSPCAPTPSPSRLWSSYCFCSRFSSAIGDRDLLLGLDELLLHLEQDLGQHLLAGLPPW